MKRFLTTALATLLAAYGYSQPFTAPNGNVGIGTSAPQSKMHIKQVTDGFDGGLKLERVSSGVTWSTVVGGDNKLYFGNASTPGGVASTALSVDTDGGAIFTNNVSAATGSNGGFQSSTYSAGHNNIWRFGNATEYGIAYYQGSANAWGSDAIGFHFGNRNTPLFYVQNNGNSTCTGSVSAATGSNGGFQSSTYSAGHNNIWRFGNAAEYGIAYYQGSANSWGSDAIGFHFGDRNAPKFFVQNNGNVGIGTANPQGYKLAVNGTIHTKEVKVDMDGWSDFVFEPSYKLPDLKETEQFIKENKHLPEIPSAAEVLKDGIKLGEMNAKLLQKIEELTLYMIDFKKEMEVVKQKNANLEKEVAQLESR